MASSSKRSESPARFTNEDLYEMSPQPPRSRQSHIAQSSMSPSPATSTSSDKENRSSRPAMHKGRGRAATGPLRVPSAAAERNKRKRTATMERDGQGERARSRRRQTVEHDSDEESENNDVDEYDPDQPIEERRGLRKGLRDLTKKVAEHRSDYMLAGNTGIDDVLKASDGYAEQVKQTTDATIDSRLLVNTAELAYKKTTALTSGDSAQGVDLEIFTTKVRAYMRAAPEDESAAPSNTQRRRGGEEEEDDDDMFNWSYLGRHACLPSIYRPATSGFLLGPLSLEKRAKRVIVRKERLRINDLQESRPEVILATDIVKNEDANLTSLCQKINTRAEEVRDAAMAAVDEEWYEDLSESEKDAILDRHGIDIDGNLALLKFVINPWSFGQTVENIFYLSFLIRNGKFGLVMKGRLPFIHIYPELAEGEDDGRDDDAVKHQAIVCIDMAEWKQCIELWDIKQPMIKHRKEEDPAVRKGGWYA